MEPDASSTTKMSTPSVQDSVRSSPRRGRARETTRPAYPRSARANGRCRRRTRHEGATRATGASVDTMSAPSPRFSRGSSWQSTGRGSGGRERKRILERQARRSRLARKSRIAREASRRLLPTPVARRDSGFAARRAASRASTCACSRRAARLSRRPASRRLPELHPVGGRRRSGATSAGRSKPFSRSRRTVSNVVHSRRGRPSCARGNASRRA